jgi:hypothetical protein
MFEGLKEFYEKNAQVCTFLLGIVCALLLLAAYFYMKKSEYAASTRMPPEARFLFGAEYNKGTEPEQASRDPRFHSEEAMTPDDGVNVPVPAPVAVPPTSNLTKQPLTQSDMTSQMVPPSQSDNDSKATSHMLTRGSVDRASFDSSRNRYLGLSSIGAADYEGYVYKGMPLSDEQGELTATVYGISESPWN